ncbi:P25 protein [Phytophthora infestans T30-4]|uniref:P25 protein n=1 Tax=Phytophthora infestans (strain T30-4) TaxID=403677 RepID=D0P0Y7_PHYIT|nr:P25 protein [Phytophthora infestans T30-4]EEY53695.1 P25 protein [Phytophthora infestans T30-4]|eukprot:XP_002896049.1 P25 protein [Phytophthora infestans T30-4]
MTNVAIIYYSMYGHVAKLASSIKAGVTSVPGVKASDADGTLLGFPTRFGGLIGKPCGIFFSSASLGGGQETTAMSMTPFIAHQGMTFVPLGYRSPLVGTNEEIHGGSPWGAGTLANADGSRQPTDVELEIAKIQGQSFAEITKKLSV